MVVRFCLNITGTKTKQPDQSIHTGSPHKVNLITTLHRDQKSQKNIWFVKRAILRSNFQFVVVGGRRFVDVVVGLSHPVFDFSSLQFLFPTTIQQDCNICYSIIEVEQYVNVFHLTYILLLSLSYSIIISLTRFALSLSDISNVSSSEKVELFSFQNSRPGLVTFWKGQSSHQGLKQTFPMTKFLNDLFEVKILEEAIDDEKVWMNRFGMEWVWFEWIPRDTLSVLETSLSSVADCAWKRAMQLFYNWWFAVLDSIRQVQQQQQQAEGFI